jgi:hypothetical protein
VHSQPNTNFFPDDEDDETLYSHMLDTRGLAFDRNILNEILAVFVFISSYALYKADVSCLSFKNSSFIKSCQPQGFLTYI